MIVFEFPREQPVTALAFSRDARYLAAAGPDGPVPIWQVATGTEAHRIPQPAGIRTESLAFHPRAPWLYAASVAGLTAFNTRTRQRRELLGARECAGTLAMDPTGRRLVVAVHKPYTTATTHWYLTCSHVANASDPSLEWEWPDRHPPHDTSTLRAAFLGDGRRFVATEATQTREPHARRLVVRAADTGDLIRAIRGPGTDADLVVAAPTGATVVASAEDRLHVFDLAKLTELPHEVQHPDPVAFTGLAFHPSGRYLGTTNDAAVVTLYDTTTWQVARTFAWDVGTMRSIAFSRDGQLAAAGSDTGTVVVWDME